MNIAKYAILAAARRTEKQDAYQVHPGRGGRFPGPRGLRNHARPELLGPAAGRPTAGSRRRRPRCRAQSAHPGRPRDQARHGQRDELHRPPGRRPSLGLSGHRRRRPGIHRLRRHLQPGRLNQGDQQIHEPRTYTPRLLSIVLRPLLRGRPREVRWYHCLLLKQ